VADTTLQDIKDRLNIVEIIGGYIQVKKAGVNFKAVCPFHNEKSASLVISPQKQIWHCFGCGEGGDIFGFVTRYENTEFRDALKLLAEKAGVKLPEYKPENKAVVDEREQLLKINDFAARFYHEMLLKSPAAEAAKRYLKKRGLTDQTIAQWKIGFAPEGFHALEQALVSKKVSIADLLKAGVSTKNEKGQVYDRFRNRITFPIFNSVGDIVGFSARILIDDGKSAKYINSPETLVYNKSKVLFGFNFVRTEIRKYDEIIVVEGQMDCISAHQAGFTNVVASSGTALTGDQLSQIARFTKNIKFCFDGDNAGLLATRRAVESALGKGFTIKIVSLVGGKDPDEIIKKDPESFQRQIANAPLFLDFYISKQFENYNQSFEDKKKVESELLPLLNMLSDPLELDHYVRILAEKLSTTPHVLLETLHTLKRPQQQAQKASTGAILQPLGVNALEKQVLGGMLLYKDYAKFAALQGSIEDFIHPEAKGLASRLFKGEPIDSNDLLAKEAVFMVESGSTEFEGGELAVKRELYKAFAMLRKNTLKQQQIELSSRIKRAEEQKQKQEVLVLSQQFAHVSKQMVELDKLL